MPADTKDAVLAPARDLEADPGRADVRRAVAVLRRFAPLLDGGEEDLREQIAEIIYLSDNTRTDWSWGDVKASPGGARCYAAADRLLPLIHARIAQAEQAATERAAGMMRELFIAAPPGKLRLAYTIAERAIRRGRVLTATEQINNLCDVIAEGDPELAARIRARNTEEDRSITEPNNRPDAAGAQIDMLVKRFLTWPLPQSVCADLCATDSEYQFPRSGTNLLSADEAKQMIEYLFAAAQPPSVHPGMTDLMISPEAVDEVIAAAPQPPAPADDVAARNAERVAVVDPYVERDRADAAESALAEVRAELERMKPPHYCFAAGTSAEEREKIVNEAERAWLSRVNFGLLMRMNRLTAERDRLAEAARAVLDHDLRDESGRQACAHLASVLAALAQPEPEKEGRS